ncbi:transporter putative [Vibrio ponticus]|nr:transporter putative [Vibrio ponticus]
MTYSTLQLMTNWYLKDVFLLSHDKAIRFAGLTMTLSMLAMIATQAWLYVKQTNARNSRLIGLLLLGIGLSLSAFSDALPYFLTSMTLVGIGFGLFLPANITLMSLQVPKEQQGLLGGANGLCQGIGLASGPLAASLLYQITPQLPFAIFASIFILMLGLIRLSSIGETNTKWSN